jgi:hypothetical protein
MARAFRVSPAPAPTPASRPRDHFAGIHHVFAWLGYHHKATILLLVLAYLVLHHHHYRRHRRAGAGFWYSLRGPWGTRWTVTKRL